ncbi:MAG TPA: serine protease [Micromonosporaceae bacterium]|nr:serine protease [Micromonosporaceae bacterium]HCU50213.1 serine protease [Micromonosporaceae bacterium]
MKRMAIGVAATVALLGSSLFTAPIVSAEEASQSYIVTFKSGTTAESEVDVSAKALAAKHRGHIGHVYSSALLGFSATLTPAAARALASDPAVASVNPDGVVRMTATQDNPPNWGLDRIDQRDLPLNNKYNYATTASNVTVYVLDTGIRKSHFDFGGRASIGADTIGDGQNGFDCQGHGTHVAGTIGGGKLGVAKGVKIVAVRVLDCEGSGTWATLIAGIDWVTRNAKKPAVVNMSLGGPGSNAPMENALRNSIASGLTYTISAGNSNANACDYTPARVSTAITVGNSNQSDVRAPDSNHGSCLDIWAPGTDIPSAGNGCDWCFQVLSGTSMAAPHVAGAAALYLAGHPNATAQQVRDALVSKASSGKLSGIEAGSPNKLVYTG